MIAKMRMLRHLARRAVCHGAPGYATTLTIVLCVAVLLLCEFAAHANGSAQLLSIERQRRWEIGASWRGASQAIDETSLLHLTQRKGRVARWESALYLRYRPSPEFSVALTATRIGLMEDVETLHLSDAVYLNRTHHTVEQWHAAILSAEKAWHLSPSSSWRLNVDATLCEFAVACRLRTRSIGVSYARIIDPIVLSAGAALTPHLARWNGAIEIVINPHLALGTVLTVGWDQKGALGAVEWGQGLIWRINEERHFSLGLEHDLLSGVPSLRFTLQTEFGAPTN